MLAFGLLEGRLLIMNGLERLRKVAQLLSEITNGSTSVASIGNLHAAGDRILKLDGWEITAFHLELIFPSLQLMNQ